MHSQMHPSFMMACLHENRHTTTNSLLEFIFQGVLLTGKSCIQQALRNILSYGSVVHHSDKVQWVSSEEEVTGIYASSPVNFAFCLSAAAVRPSIFPLFLYMFPILCVHFPSFCCLCLASDLRYLYIFSLPWTLDLHTMPCESIHISNVLTVCHITATNFMVFIRILCDVWKKSERYCIHLFEPPLL